MAFDILFARALANELNNKLAKGKVEKVNQITKENLVISIRAAGENYKLIVSTNASCARIGLTNKTFENPSVPPMFTMLLRKHLGGAILEKIDTLGFDRIICLHFSGYDELGFKQEKILICELMGKYSNIILTDDKYKIYGVNRPVDLSENRVRQILPGMIYERPPYQNKIEPCDVTRERFIQLYNDFISNNNIDNDALASFILKTYAGISPCIAREIVYRTNIDESNNRYIEKLYSAYSTIITSVEEMKLSPCVVYDKDNKPIEYSFVELKQYPEYIKKLYPDLSSLLDSFYSDKESITLLKNRVGNLDFTVKNLIKKTQRKIINLNEELGECEDMDKYRLYGELITSSLYMLNGKSKECEVLNYYTGTNVKIPLDEKLSPSQNANKYFKKYNKLKSQKENANVQLEKALGELDYLYSVLDSLDKCTCNDDAKQIKDELKDLGYIKGDTQGKEKKKQINFNPIILTTSTGKTVRVGKNNTQNDYLTLKFSDKEDYWFHVKNAPGSHVVLENNGDEIEDDDIIQTAEIAAYYSSQKQSSQVPVDYVKIRYVKKPQGSKPGYVIFTNNKTVYVTPKVKE